MLLFRLTGAASLLVLAAYCCATLQVRAGEEPAPKSSEVKLPRLFDFDYYKQLFGKRYSSWLEELSRKRYFLSRALRAYVSAVMYKFRQREHFNAVNHLSDLSPEEVRLTRNRQIEAPADVQLESAPGQSQLPELLADEGEDVERKLAELIRTHGHEPAYEPLKRELERTEAGRRRKRSALLEKPREFSMDWLINADSGSGRLPPARTKHLTSRLESNNPFYEPIEVMSFGLIDQQERVRWRQVARKNKRPLEEQLEESLGRETEGKLSAGDQQQQQQPDELFVDHRLSGCLLEPRNQGLCGCCYAFATITLLEWYLCKRTGELTPLSEQYMIDCGRGRFGEALNGCQGGLVTGAADFVHNFGLETARHYPYAAREGQCPYADDYDLKRTGFIRLELADALAIGQERWAHYLERAPLYVQAKAGDEFEEYGGGVDLGQACARTTNHAMVLVGRGRQDGREYWLLRNSYATSWGERGYWKLARSATAKCLGELAYVYGTSDGINFTVEPKANA